MTKTEEAEPSDIDNGASMDISVTNAKDGIGRVSFNCDGRTANTSAMVDLI